MNKNISVKKIVIEALLILFIANQPAGIFADGFASETNGIKEFPGLIYDHHIEKLMRSIVSQIEGTGALETNLKIKGLKSEDICLLIEARYVRIKNYMDELVSALSAPPPNPQPKYNEIIHALEIALKDASNFDESAGTIEPVKDDVEYWIKRIGTLGSALRKCSEFRFSPVENDTKLQQVDEKNAAIDSNIQPANQKFGFWWYISIFIIMSFAVFLFYRKHKTRHSSRQE